MNNAQAQLYKMATDDNFVKFVSSSAKVRDAFFAFHMQTAQPIHVVKAILEAQIEYAGKAGV